MTAIFVHREYLKGVFIQVHQSCDLGLELLTLVNSVGENNFYIVITGGFLLRIAFNRFFNR